MVTLPSHPASRSLVVECVDRTHATMYLDRPLTMADALELRQLTEILPAPVRVLRVQLRAVDANPQTMNALRDVVRAWRPRGNVHLVFIGGFAPGARQTSIDVPAGNRDVEWSSPAHTAAFL